MPEKKSGLTIHDPGRSFIDNQLFWNAVDVLIGSPDVHCFFKGQPIDMGLQFRSSHALITLNGADCATFEFDQHYFKYFFDNYSLYSRDGTIIALKVK